MQWSSSLPERNNSAQSSQKISLGFVHSPKKHHLQHSSLISTLVFTGVHSGEISFNAALKWYTSTISPRISSISTQVFTGVRSGEISFNAALKMIYVCTDYSFYKNQTIEQKIQHIRYQLTPYIYWNSRASSKRRQLPLWSPMSTVWTRREARARRTYWYSTSVEGLSKQVMDINMKEERYRCTIS